MQLNKKKNQYWYWFSKSIPHSFSTISTPSQQTHLHSPEIKLKKYTLYKKEKEKPTIIHGVWLRVLSEVHHDHANVVSTVPSQRQLRQQHRRVRARLVGRLRRSYFILHRRTRGRVSLTSKTHTRHPTRRFIGHHVPQPVTRQDQTVVLRRSIRDRHLRLAAHVGFQIVITCGNKKR